MLFRRELASAPLSRGRELLDQATRACAPHYTAAWIFSGLIALLYLAPSIYMLQVYDRVLSTGGVMTLIFISVILLVALFTHGYLDGVRQRLLTRAGLRLDHLLGDRIIRHSFDPVRSGTQADARHGQILREFDTYRQSLQGPAAVARLDLPYAPLFVIVAFMLHVWLGVLILAGALLLVIIAIMGERATQRELAASAARTPSIYAAAELGQTSGGAIRALGMQGAMASRLMKERDNVNLLGARSSFVAMRYSGAIRLLRMILQSASLGLGAYLCIIQEITPGSLIAASILSGRALAPIDQIVGAWRQLGQARAARQALITYLDTAPLDVTRTELPVPDGAIDIQDVAVRAGATDRFALQDISLSLPAGQILGVVGASGAGKSTLARVLVGAQTPDTGTVRVDGGNIADWDSDRLGAHVGYLPQEPTLFAGTIADNICRFAQGNNSEKVVAAAKAAGVHEMILGLSKGYDTVLGPRGLGLSAGQSQRLALARALYNDPKILVFDEPNAHLDTDGDASLLQTLTAAKARGATVVLMTHRSGILAVADRMLVLADGRIAQLGPRDQVLAGLRRAAVQSGQVRTVGDAS